MSRRALVVAAALIVLVLAMCGVHAVWYAQGLLHPARAACERGSADCPDPSTLSLRHREVEFVSRDGTQLEGWLVEHDAPRFGVVLVHGRGGDRRELLGYVPALHAAAAVVLTLDLRNSGRSGGKRTSMGVHEADDVRAAVAQLTSTGVTRVGVFGVSIGAVAGLLAAADTPSIAAVAAEASYATLADQIASRMQARFHTPRWLGALTARFFAWRAGFALEQADAVGAVRRLAGRPLLLIEDELDAAYLRRHAGELWEAAREPKERWLAQGATHASAWRVRGAEAERKVSEFFAYALTK